jgi:hypothetical protein
MRSTRSRTSATLELLAELVPQAGVIALLVNPSEPRTEGLIRDSFTMLARRPRARAEAALAGPDKPTTSSIINAAFPPKPKPVAPEALWLWGRLRDFERDGLLDTDPAEVLATMTAEMLDDVRSLAPQVAAWLDRIGG